MLVGTAGGLTPEALSGSARVIARLVDPLGALLPFPTFAAAASTWTAVGVDRPVATPDGKRALATASGADVVDMESHRFASEAVARGVPFAIVRGVSDGVDDALPAGVERLVDRSGRTRIAAAIGLLVRRPGLVGPLKRLGQRTAAAMESAARTLDTLLPRESSSDR